MAQINSTESFLFYTICAIADGAEFGITTFFADLLGVGELIKPMINLGTWATVGFWLKMKGVSQKNFAIGSGGELLPGINALPWRTIGMYFTLKEARAREQTS